MHQGKADKKKQGKRNRAAGQRFELKVRKYLEKEGWIVAKWTNNMEIRGTPNCKITDWKENEGYRIVPAKHKFNFFTKVMSMGTGFPDFIAFRLIKTPTTKWMASSPDCNCIGRDVYDIIGVECKSGKYLDKAEKLKCAYLLQDNIFSKILVAYKGKKRGEIIYEKFSV